MQMLNNNNGSTASSFWQQSAFSYKLYLTITCILFVLSFMFTSITQTLVDIPYLTAFQYELWRLFLSLFVLPPKLMSILGIVFAFVWMHRLIKDTQRGTIYTIIQVLLINFQVHLLFNIISYPFVLYFEQSMQSPYFYGYFWFKVIIVYEFRQSIRKPDQQRKFCFLPFTVKGKYYPYLIVVMTAALSQQLVCTLAATFIGLLQEVYKKQMLIRLPFGFYNFMQRIVPNIIKNRSDFVNIKDKANQLLHNCWGASNISEDGNNINEANLKSRYIFNASDGVPLDNRNKLIINDQQQEMKRNRHFTNYWASKQIPVSTQTASDSASQSASHKQKAWQSKIDPKILQAPQIPQQFKMKLAYLQQQYKEQQKNKTQTQTVQAQNQEKQEHQQCEYQDQDQVQDVFNKKGIKKTSRKKIAQQDDDQIQMAYR